MTLLNEYLAMLPAEYRVYYKRLLKGENLVMFNRVARYLYEHGEVPYPDVVLRRFAHYARDPTTGRLPPEFCRAPERPSKRARQLEVRREMDDALRAL